MFGYVGKYFFFIFEFIFIYSIFFRGRVGYNGQNNLEHFGCDLDDAKRFFCQKYLF
jgi:hypothetical protein